jgi:hypothetical protein
MVQLSRSVFLFILSPHRAKSYNPKNAETLMVWAVPRSLAATEGITIVFYSSGYLDVSVHRVGFFRCYAFSVTGFPIRTSAG